MMKTVPEGSKSSILKRAMRTFAPSHIIHYPQTTFELLTRYLSKVLFLLIWIYSVFDKINERNLICHRSNVKVTFGFSATSSICYHGNYL